jgi:hypothetical protein
MTRSSRHHCGSPEHFSQRRAFLGAAGGALLGGALGNSALAEQLERKQKRVLLIFLNGGMSQLESWDPKPGQSTGGPFLSIPTTVPGYQISELMPEMAKRIAKYTAVIRSLESKNGNHGAGGHLVLRGGRPNQGLKYPSLGCMLAQELAPPASPVPDHVMFTNYGGDNYFESGGFLGARYDPLKITPVPIPNHPKKMLRIRLAPEGNKLPESLSDEQHQQRGALRDQLSREFTYGRQRDNTLASHQLAYARVRGLMASDRLFDIEQEPAAMRARYGPSWFGKQALIARRLLEADVPYVRVNYSWWDHHGQNFEFHHEMVPILDHVLSVLLDDLNDRGLLEHTLVVTLSEMGRSPGINKMMGRDHFSRMSVTLSGCGIKPGVIHGKTDDKGGNIADGLVTLQQFFATIFRAVGIDHEKEYPALDGRPVPLTDYGTKPVMEVLA